MFTGPFDASIIKRAADAGLIEIAIHDIRAWTYDRHRTADDAPYGGGAGMVMMAPPIVEGVETILGDDLPKARVIVTAASGRRFTQRVAEELAREERLVIICGHYEGIDARVTELLHAEEYSIGDYVLTGGELPAMVMIDAIGRLLPGVIQAASIEEESHSESLVEYPHYTRPVTYRDLDVPPILLSGHHAKIAAWRSEQAIERTKERRPELLDLEDE
jgi:tRNA (guanine37-N1)-methyltransferase